MDFDAKPSTPWLQYPKCTAPASFITMVRPLVPDVNPKQFNTSAHDAPDAFNITNQLIDSETKARGSPALEEGSR